MDTGWMATCCPGARLLGPAVLEGYRFMINLRGDASVDGAEGSRVYGLTWLVTEAHLRELDQYEGVAEGYYSRSTVHVRAESGPTPAWIYIACDNRPGRVPAPYLDQVVAAARAAAFPEHYVGELLRAGMPATADGEA